MLRKKSPPRSMAARRYYQKRQRQQRLAMLFLAGLILIGLVLGGLWGLISYAPRVFAQVSQNFSVLEPLVIHTPEDNKAFEHWMDQEFGLLKVPSLLYYQNMDYTLLSGQQVGLFKRKLMPVMPLAEDEALKAQLMPFFNAFSSEKYKPHFYFYNPQNRTYVAINGYDPVPAASVIKLPILLDYLMNLDEQMIQVDTPLLYAEFHRAGGAGELQYQDAGKAFLANDVAGQMIRISDNTCTNMMISFLGGTEAVNQRFAELGLVHTRIRNWLPDLSGTNTISPYEMVNILYNLDASPLISQMSRYNGIDILKSTHNRRLMVWPLPQEAKVAHKTGDIGTSLGDSGTVYLPDGRKYYFSMQVERPYNDYSIRDLFHHVSGYIYNYVAAQPTQTEGVAAALEASSLPLNRTQNETPTVPAAAQETTPAL